MINSNFDDVGRFHNKFALPHVVEASEPHSTFAPGPREVDQELLEFRMKFMLEELLEFAEAHGYMMAALPGHEPVFEKKLVRREAEMDPIGFTPDHPKAFDALLDLAYVVFGTAHVFGYPWQRGWDEVQERNMRKIRCERVGDSTRGSTYDVVKPPGWTPPDITGLLRKFGWPV